MCCSRGGCEWEGTAPSTPPKGGWMVIGIPPLPMISRDHVDAYSCTKFHTTSLNGTVNAVFRELQALGYAVTEIEKHETCNWVKRQLCARDPSRCHYMHGGYSPKGPLSWAPAFWEEWNDRLSDDAVNPGAINVMFAQDGVNRTAESETGCIRCHEHWVQYLEKFPPDENATLEEARLWKYEAQNFTKQYSKKPTWREVCKKNGW